tara:strand:- start:3785 stop:4117 length:333 start_codon:yes stop_codon:yes gene_type:complete
MTTETKTTHTPGPWVFIPGGPGSKHGMSAIQVADDPDCPDHPMLIGFALFSPQNAKQQPEDLANARLFAAAPDLLEACRLAAEHWAYTNAPIGNVLRDAIAKAEGSEATT